MGNHIVMAPATTEEVRQLSASISWNIQALATTVESAFSKTMNRQDILQPMIGEVQMVGGTNITGLGYEHPGSNQLAFEVGLPQSNEGWDSQMTTVSHQLNMSDSTSQHSRLGSHRRSASAPPIADFPFLPWAAHLGHGAGLWSSGLRWICTQGLPWKTGPQNGTQAWCKTRQQVCAVNGR